MAHLLAGDLLDADDALAVGLVPAAELRRDRFLGQDHVIPVENRERLVPDEAAGGQDGMSQSPRAMLPHEMDVRQLGDGGHPFGDLLAALAAEGILQLVGVVKMILDKALSPAGDHQDIGDPGGGGLFNDILNRGLVHDREHFLGHRL